MKTMENAWFERFQSQSSFIEREVLKEIKNERGLSSIEAAMYVLTGGNDYRVGFYRANIAFFAGNIFHLKKEDLRDSAVGIEYIHTSSLIFDDLPCMDDALVRRGKKAVHLVYGEATATLGAIFLLSKGTSLLIRNAEKFKRVSDVRFELEKTIGKDGLIGGQEIDLFRIKNKMTASRGYFRKNRLMYFSLVLPSILSGREYFKELDCVGRDISIAYQCHDDLRDFESKRIVGKEAQKRSKRLIDFVSKEKVIEIKEEKIKRVKKRLEKIPRSEGLIGLVEFMFKKL